jgi:hypothetical protein
MSCAAACRSSRSQRQGLPRVLRPEYPRWRAVYSIGASLVPPALQDPFGLRASDLLRLRASSRAMKWMEPVVRRPFAVRLRTSPRTVRAWISDRISFVLTAPSYGNSQKSRYSDSIGIRTAATVGSSSAENPLAANARASYFGSCWVIQLVDGWQTLATKPIDQPIELAA